MWFEQSERSLRRRCSERRAPKALPAEGTPYRTDFAGLNRSFSWLINNQCRALRAIAPGRFPRGLYDNFIQISKYLATCGLCLHCANLSFVNDPAAACLNLRLAGLNLHRGCFG